MRFYINDLKYVRRNKVILEYVNDCHVEDNLVSDLFKGLTNIDKLTTTEPLEIVDVFESDDGNCYNVLRSQYGCFITREDNVVYDYDDEDVLSEYGIRKIIRSGDKTILIEENGDKYITTKDNVDKDDIEKAVMILLLKKAGYSVKDIYSIVDMVEYKK